MEKTKKIIKLTISLVLMLALIGAMFLLRRKVYAFEWMMHFTAAVPCLCYAAWLTILMGLTVQTRQGGVPWLSQMLRFWPFVLIWTWMMVIAGLAALNHLLRTLPDETTIYPGHGVRTSAAIERQYNPYLDCAGS